MKRITLQIVFLFLMLSSFGQTHRLAILDLCERNAEINKENLASAIHMAEVAGMPYYITSSIEEAIQKPFILITSSLRDETLSSIERGQLIDFVRNGGIVIAPFIKSTLYFDLFGINYTKYASSRYWMYWDIGSGHPDLKWINEENERVLPLADPEYSKSIYTRGYTASNCSVLANFDDGTAAVTSNDFGEGKAYALGFELKDLVLRNLLNKDYSTQRTWSNGFEPTTDVILLFLRAVYTENQSTAVYKHTSPGNSTSALLITHDVDSQTGMDSMFYFSEWEANNGIKAHYFITTRYFSDGLMSNYYKEENYSKMKSLLDNGHQIGSHSVGHFPDFANMTIFPIGEIGNKKENYQPAYHNGVTIGGTVTGELEVSRDLLNNDIGANVRSFRSGYHAFNLRLTNVLSDLDFAFNSSQSANNLLTNFPFRQRTNSAYSGSPTNVYEMPMTISDASKSFPLSEETIDIVVARWQSVLSKNDANNAPTVLLIHPNRGWKLGVQQAFLENISSTVIPYEFNAFGDYWLERRDLDFDYNVFENTLQIRFVSDQKIGEEQSIIISNGRDLTSIELFNLSGEPLDYQIEDWKDEDLLITKIVDSLEDPEPDLGQYTLIINSKDENSDDLINVDWQVLSADSTLIGEGNTGANAQDTLQFFNINDNINIIIKTNKIDYEDYRAEISITAEQEVQINTINGILFYFYQLEVSSKDIDTGFELDSIFVNTFLNGELLMQGESLEDRIVILETLQAEHPLDIKIIVERNGYITSDSISTTLIEGIYNQEIIYILKEDTQEPTEQSSVARLAVLDLCYRNDETNKENLASAIQMADVAGVPYFITTSVNEACEVGFMLLTSEIDDFTLSNEELLTLKGWVENGGIIIAPFIKNTDLFEVFGIETTKLDQYRYTLNWTGEEIFSELKWIDDPREKTLPLSDIDYYKSIYTRGYTVGTAKVMAYFEDGKVAVCRNRYGKGIAYAFGVKWKDVILRNLLNKDYYAQRSYSNDFEPTTDVFMLLLRGIFTENQVVSVYKHTSPGRSTSTLLITHDVDSRRIIATMNTFSNWEFINGISTHYFVATHYFKDSYMSAYFEDPNFEKIQELLERNHTIGSHSVGHFPDFAKTSIFPTGVAGNTQFSYQPFYNGSYTVGGTVYGELEVSRDLLNNDIGANVRSFRAGALAFNPRLINVMQDLGYAFNSSMSANNVLTNFPYFQRTNRAFSGSPTDVLEIPLTIKDESTRIKLEETNIDEVLDIWIDVIERNDRNNAPSTLLISPNREWKLQALQGLLARIPSGVITYNFEDFGDYWLDRKALDFDYSLSDGILTIEIKSELAPAEDLSLVLENGLQLNQVFVVNSLGENISFKQQNWNEDDVLITFGEEEMRQQKSAKIDVQAIVEESQFSLFPNPAKDYVNLLFDLKMEEKYSIRIFDFNGRDVFFYEGFATIGTSMQRIDLSVFSSGIYLMNFESETIQETLKLSINN